MGQYTELVLAVELKQDVSIEVLTILRGLMTVPVDDDTLALAKGLHPFFETSRWTTALVGESIFFPGRANTSLVYDDEEAEAWFLTIRSNFKNYDNEIQKFIDWIAPYVEADWPNFAGYMRYEEDDLPTLIFFNDASPVPQYAFYTPDSRALSLTWETTTAL